MFIPESQYDGTCFVCGKRYAKKSPIEWVSRGKARHAECKPKEPVSLETVLFAAFASMRGAETIDQAVTRATDSIALAFDQYDVVAR